MKHISYKEQQKNQKLDKYMEEDKNEPRRTYRKD